MINLTFANIVIMVLELKNYSINIMIRDVWKLKDSKKKCLLKMKKIKHHFQKLRCPFVVYADFPCLTEELKTAKGDEMKTYNYQEHKPCGFMLNLVNAVDNTNHEFV